MYVCEDVMRVYDIYVYRSDTVNSKSFVGMLFLRIKWKFELQFNSTLIFDEATRVFFKNFELSGNLELTVFELTAPDLYVSFFFS